MATNPTKPGSDGGTAVATLADYAEWSFTSTADDPAAPEGTTVADGTTLVERAAASPSGAEPRPTDWASWVLRRLSAELRARMGQQDLPDARRKALERALERMKGWK
jgi:hypothetical protein